MNKKPRLELEVFSSGRSVRTISVTDTQRLFVGRGIDNDESFPDDLLMSTRHFSVVYEYGIYVVEDLRSTNGLFANGSRLRCAHELKHGDEVTAGQTRFVVSLHDAATANEEDAESDSMTPSSTHMEPHMIPSSDPVMPASNPVVPVPEPPVPQAAQPAPSPAPPPKPHVASPQPHVAAPVAPVAPSPPPVAPPAPVAAAPAVPAAPPAAPAQAAPKDQHSDDLVSSHLKTPSTQAIPSELAKEPERESGVDGIEQLHLKIISNPEEGTVYWLTPGQSQVMGRGAKCDRCLDFDPSLSTQHFRIECQRDHCKITDLESTNGTFVNDKRIAAARLFDGDIIRAGDTFMLVSVTGSKSAISRTADVEAAPEAPTKMEPAENELVLKELATGLLLGADASGEMDVAEIIRRLSQSFKMHLIVDFNRFGIDRPDTLDASTLIFDWMGEAAETMSPCLFAADDVPEWPEFVEEGFGCDAVICLFSSSDTSALLANFRRLCHGNIGTDNGKGMLGVCWPSVMNPLLQHGEADLAGLIMDGIDIVLNEAKDAPWHIFGGAKLIEQLEGVGIGGAIPTDDIEEEADDAPKA